MTKTNDGSALSLAAEGWRGRGASIVVVQGLGFVGSAVATSIASARTASGKPAFFVIGVDLPSEAGRSKVESMNAGRPPVDSPDATFARLLGEAREIGNLVATTEPSAYGLADVLVVDVHLDVENVAVGAATDISVRMETFERALSDVGRHMRAQALVVIESTVPPGTTIEVATRTLTSERRKRGIDTPPRVVHSYERVMPGPNYIASIKN